MDSIGQLGLLLGVTILIIVVGFVLKKQMRVLSVRVRGEQIRRDDVRRKLKQIQGMLDLEAAQSRRLAVMEMYKLFDFVLKRMGFTGETMRERLEQAMKYEPSLRAMTDQYDLAHRLAGNGSTSVDDKQSRAALDTLRAALTTLHIL